MPGQNSDIPPFMDSEDFRKICEAATYSSQWNHNSLFRDAINASLEAEERECRIRQEIRQEMKNKHIGTIKAIALLNENEMTEEQRYRFRQSGVRPFGIIECDIYRRTEKEII